MKFHRPPDRFLRANRPVRFAGYYQFDGRSQMKISTVMEEHSDKTEQPADIEKRSGNPATFVRPPIKIRRDNFLIAL
jgi:hypothetical protein